MLTSVIIPTYNSLKVLKKSLPAITQQKLDPGLDYEVILINDGSTDGTGHWLEQQQLPRLTCLTLTSNQGRSVARNQGLAHARGQVIVFLDSDVIAVPTLVQAHLDALHIHANTTEFEHRVSSGRLINTANLDNPADEHYKLSDFSAAHFATGNTAIAKTFLTQVQEKEYGPFDQDIFSVYGWEDLELGVRLKALKMQYQRNSKALGYHYCPPFTLDSIPARLKKEIQRAHTANRFYAKHPSLDVRLMTQKTPIHRALWELLSLGGLLSAKRLTPLLSWLIKHNRNELAESIARHTFLNLTHIRHLKDNSHDIN